MNNSAIKFFLVCLVATTLVSAQSKKPAASKGLYEQIVALDTSFFEAYNKCDLTRIESLLSDDVEFYHEKRGVITTRENVMKVISKNLCGDPGNKVRRVLVKGSMQVYAIENYGALAIGQHRFYLTQTGQKEKLDGTGRFANLWQNKNGEWKMSRVFSYGF